MSQKNQRNIDQEIVLLKLLGKGKGKKVIL